MAFKGITFAGQNVTPKNDGGLYQAHCGDGILWGCSMAVSGDDLVIQSGEFIAGGRVCFVDGATSVDLSTRVNANGYIQVIMNYDLTQGEGSQWYATFVESASTSFPALTQDDINDAGTLYQFELAVVAVVASNLDSVYSTAPASGLVNEGNYTFTRSGVIAGRLSVSGTGGVMNLAKISGGNAVGGVYVDSTDATMVYGENGLYLRPNGQNDSTGQINLTTAGQQIGGHPITTRNPGGSVTLSSSMSTLTSLTAGIETAGVYFVSCECDYAAAQATGHYPQLEVQNGIKNTYYTATTGSRHFCLSGIVTGMSSIVFRGATGTGSTNATATNITILAVRIH